MPSHWAGENGTPARDWAAPGLLLAAVLLVFLQTGGFAYIALDDPRRVMDNPHVLSGLSWDNLRWAFTNRELADSYPLTWVSFQAVAQLFGIAAGPQHLANVLLHAANTLLLHNLLRTATGQRGPSLVVAGLFALHPLHVESVAWVSGRKDVLSSLFWLLALRAYLDYARRPALGRYLAVAAAFALGLLAKSMLVTLPLTLLILDFWPLARTGEPPPGLARFRGVAWLLVEKLPLFAIAAVAGLGTFAAQAGVGAISGWEALPLSLRLANAAVAAVAYLGKLFWPVGLAVFYPHPGYTLSIPMAVLAMLVLAALSLAAWRCRRSCPFALAGWLWYGVTLLPVIGIVQIGAQSMADRYTYIALIGPCWALVWGWSHVTTGLRAVPRWAPWALVLAVCAVVAALQTARWRDTRTLFEHATRVTQRNWLAHMVLGRLHLQERRYPLAVNEFRAAAAQASGLDGVHGYLGLALVGLGRNREALESFRREQFKNPQDPAVNLFLGVLHVAAGRPQAAQPYLQRAAQARGGNLLQLQQVEHQAAILLARTGKQPEQHTVPGRVFKERP